TMGEQTLAVLDEHDVAFIDVVDAAAVNREDIARADRREHAPTRGAKPHAAEAAEHARQQRGSDAQEFFLTNLHWPMTGFVLPHASAIVSKSCSRTKAGF